MPKESTDTQGREAYRKSLEMNHAGVPSHGRKSKPLSADKRAELARLYDAAMRTKQSPQ